MWAILASTIAVITAAFSNQGPVGDPALELSQQFIGAYQARNPAVAVATLAPEATVFWINQNLQGRQAIGQFLTGQLQAYDAIRFNFSGLTPLNGRDLSVVWGDFVLETRLRNGISNGVVFGHYSAVARQVNRQWQLVHVQLAATPR